MSETNSTPEVTPVDPAAGLTVRSLIIPLNGVMLLMPNTAVAEVSDYKAPQPAVGAPAWFLGMLLWRGRSIPLVAFEPLMGRAAGVGGVHARAVVCNTLNANPTLPFIAILTQGLPRLQELKSDMIEISPSAPESSAVAASVMLGGQEAVIPDLDDLERQLLQLGVRVG